MAKKQYNVKTSAVAATERRARKYGAAGGSGGTGIYIDVAGDVAGKLDRSVFESMFERIVTGTDDNGNEKWYIRAKATLVSVGDVVAYGVSDITGGAGGGSSTLANLKDVLFGTLKDGDVIKWDASLGKWVNGQGGGGLDESQLAAYLQQHNYVTEADLGNYVTVGTEQTITGKKTFGADETFFTRRATVNGDYDSFDNYPHIMWHVPNQQFTKMLMDVNGNLHLLHGGSTALNNYRGLTVSSIAKSGGTSTQFLKADGSVDGNNYLAYVPQNGGLKSQVWLDTWGSSVGSIVAEFTDSSGSSAFKFKKDNPQAGMMSLVIDGTVYINEGMEAVASQAWAVCKAGDTMTGMLKVPSIELTTISGIKFTNNILGGSGDVAKMYITGTGEAQQLTFEVQNDADDIINFITPDNNGLKKNGNTIWHAGNDGSGSGLNADLLDGAHNGWVTAAYLKFGGNQGARTGFTPYEDALAVVGVYANGYPTTYGNCLRIPGLGGGELLFGWSGIGGAGGIEHLYYRNHRDNNSQEWSEWRTIAFTTDNVASASKLQTARTLYITSYNSYRAGDGVAFDGTGDVILKLPNSITASDWFRSYGASGWYNQDYGGGIYMSDTSWVRIFNDKCFYTGGEIRSDGQFNRMGDGGSSWNMGKGAYNIWVPNNGNQMPLLLAYRNDVWDTGANRLFAMELLSNGAQLNFGFGGAAKFYFYSGGTFVATGDVTAYSDARLKSDIRPLVNRGFIEPKTYVKDGKRSIGFLAQDVRAIYPELVTETGGADNWLALNYGNLVAVLEAQIIDHEERIKRLEGRA